MKIKICGMKYEENIQEVAELQPDYMGFIFYEKSPRYFKGYIPTLPKTTQKVGVFVDAYLDDVLDKVRRYNLQYVQLHGNETPAFCKAFKQTDAKVIKVFPVDDDFTFDTIKPYETVCDYFLFDTKGKYHGGNGATFNWHILNGYPSEKPFFLSGGIGLDEIPSIQKLNLPIHAIDVNSKFEIEPGIKNVADCERLTDLLKH
ncbi:phosphoribosylanthranilate isomerase [Flavobacterium amniphilum]|uniref:phosphoribosylanthranilate isomerase n=1 Tax=Flavobacterium amniphilum TaxID=1834035 RepID=UPI00202AB96B|nr:phosphoribosylanthranilate isomerase [Flavobacterium amniphilum]MCL9807110.1 phosphoribosylanthranilate isomerase [Flavobacterium amniphilum]